MTDLFMNLIGLKAEKEFSSDKPLNEVKADIASFIIRDSQIDGEMKGGHHFMLKFRWNFLMQFRSQVTADGVVWPQANGSKILVTISAGSRILGVFIPFCIFVTVGVVGFILSLSENYHNDVLGFLAVILFGVLFLIPVFILRYHVKSLARYIGENAIK